MNSRERKLAVTIAKWAIKEGPHRIHSGAKQLLYFAEKRPSKGKGLAKARKQEKAQKHRDETAEIRAAVMARAGGVCECGCARLLSIAGQQMDHWLGGNGRRRQQQSVQTCWMLTIQCHAARTVNVPSAEEWNRRFARHCEKYGYPFTPHITHSQLPARESGPSANPPSPGPAPVRMEVGK